MMKINFIFCIMALLVQILCWLPTTSIRLLPPINNNNNHSSHQPGIRVNIESIQEAASYTSTQKSEEPEQPEGGGYRGMNQAGSRPPNCEHKCDGCSPCIATQVPTVTSRLGIQFANYEPECWKCKCGPSVFSP